MVFNKKKSNINFSKFIYNSLTVLISISLTSVFVEMGYRMALHLKGTFRREYYVSNSMPIVFDNDYGVQVIPNKKFNLFKIVNGKVTYCQEAIAITNKDGLCGKTTIAEYEDSDIKILAFGDSFTTDNQQGYTWPDLLEEILSKLCGKLCWYFELRHWWVWYSTNV